MRFSDQTVIVTGASLGVGRATAAQFVAEGANVVLVARRQGPLDEAASSIGHADRVWTYAADVSDHAALVGLVDGTVERFGGLQGLVNNAGAHFRGPVETRTATELSTMVDVNLRAPIALSRLVLPHMRQAGSGFIVNVASLAGKLPLDGAATYSATKFGLRAFTIALAEELRGTGITVSAVSPGPIETGFILEELDEVADIVFSQAMCTADDVAGWILDCAHDGQIEREFPFSGGKLATLGYLLPALRRWLKPRLSARGAAAKAALKAKRSNRS